MFDEPSLNLSDSYLLVCLGQPPASQTRQSATFSPTWLVVEQQQALTNLSPVGLHDNILSKVLISWYHWAIWHSRCDIGRLTDHGDVRNPGSQGERISLQVSTRYIILDAFKPSGQMVRRRDVKILTRLRLPHSNLLDNLSLIQPAVQ